MKIKDKIFIKIKKVEVKVLHKEIIKEIYQIMMKTILQIPSMKEF